MSRCALHDNATPSDLPGWAESQTTPELPMVHTTLHELTLHIHSLLQSHGGTISLFSIVRCYEMEVGMLNIQEEKGVPLEHLISCVKGVEIVSHAGQKHLQWAGKKCDPLHLLNPSLVPQISLFCRELVDLLKVAPRCRIPFSKFIPAYHHHFGRQCRVADYGYTRLIDLLESLHHVVQVFGEGSRRHLTLSHRAQMKRFTSDLIRILKCQTSKQIPISQFSIAYEKIMLRPFDPRDYGLCELADLLVQVAEASVVVMGVFNGESVIGMPKREQTFEEMEKTIQFAAEVIELLKHAPQCKLDFAKFIPAYHHHFGKQCRVADYGCAKLVELFEAIPETVQIIEVNSEFEKFVQLTVKQRLHILAQQIAVIIKETSENESLLLSNLPELFYNRFGFALRPDQYGAGNLEALVAKLKSRLQVCRTKEDVKLCLINQNTLEQIRDRIMKLLYPIPDGRLAIADLQQQYKMKYNDECFINFVTDHMDDVVCTELGKGNQIVVCLTPLVLFCRLVHRLLIESSGRLPLASLESRFLERFGSPIRPSVYGFTSLHALLLSVPHMIAVRGKGSKRYILMQKGISDLDPPNHPRHSFIDLKPPASWLASSTGKTAKENQNNNLIEKARVEFTHRLATFALSPPSKYSISHVEKTRIEPAHSTAKQVASSSNKFSVPPVLSPWALSSIWGFAVGVPLAQHHLIAGISGAWNPSLNQTIAPNRWVTAWHPPFSYPLTIASFACPKIGSTDDAKANDRVSSHPVGNPPPASLLPLPPQAMRTADIPKSRSVKSRIVAQFKNHESSYKC